MGRLILIFCLAAAAWGADCSRSSVGYAPFTDPFPAEYKGFPVSLYPNGNSRPAAHEKLGREAAARIVPRDSSGNPAADGKIVLLSVGMSNTTQEFSAFLQRAKADQQKSPRVQPVDGAIGGKTAALIASQPDQYWPLVDQRLQMAGVSAAQVQAIWLKEADSSPNRPFPQHAQTLQGEIQTVIQQARARFPNLAAVYLSSRIYGGYASTSLNPEPYAYEGAFAVKWLIEKQIDGAPELDSSAGAFPWLSWGPYLWADGLKPRASDGLYWECADLRENDGTHPSESGQKKVAAMLLDFLHSDSTARLWYAVRESNPTPVIGAVVNSAGWAGDVANSSLASIFGVELASGTAQAFGYPLPHELAGTRVEVDGVALPLYYVSPDQINVVLPLGGAALNVVRGDTASASRVPGMLLAAPGLYTWDLMPNGPAAALHADGTPVTDSSPAQTGETVHLFGTGLGLVSPLLTVVVPVPQVQIGGVTVEAKASAWPPGVTSLAFAVPSAVPPATATPIVFRLGTASSNTATLPVR